jgi:hypothetical protein
MNNRISMRFSVLLFLRFPATPYHDSNLYCAIVYLMRNTTQKAGVLLRWLQQHTSNKTY